VIVTDFLKGCKIDVDGLKGVLSASLVDVGINALEVEDGYYIEVTTSEGVLCDFRLTRNVIELYINLSLGVSRKFIDALPNLGLGVLLGALLKIEGVANTLPKSVIISKVLPSNTLYLILEPADSLPPVKGTYKDGGVSIITPTCTLSNNEVVCDDEGMVKILKELSTVLSELGREVMS